MEVKETKLKNFIFLFIFFIDLKHRQLWQLSCVVGLRSVEEHVYVRR